MVKEEKKESKLNGQNLILGAYEKAVMKLLKDLEKKDFVKRLWAKDTSLWKEEADHVKIIKNSLGWLKVADFMASKICTPVRVP